MKAQIVFKVHKIRRLCLCNMHNKRKFCSLLEFFLHKFFRLKAAQISQRFVKKFAIYAGKDGSNKQKKPHLSDRQRIN